MTSDTHTTPPAPAVPQGEPLGYINAGHLHEIQSGRVPYVYVYAAPGAGAEVPVYTTPSQEPVAEQETLVGLSLHGKELRNENVVYDGGPLDLTDCKLRSCYIELSKAAARTVQFLAIAEQSQPGFLQPLFADAVRLTTSSLEPVAWLDLSKMSASAMVYATGWKSNDKQSPLYAAPAPAQEPVTPDPGQWCQYVAGMIFCWLQMQKHLPDEDRFVEAIAGIIQRRLWAYKPYQDPVAIAEDKTSAS